MNCKLEKFWNTSDETEIEILRKWTVNLKSFEIFNAAASEQANGWWTVNLKSFEILMPVLLSKKEFLWTVNLKSFEILQKQQKVSI